MPDREYPIATSGGGGAYRRLCAKVDEHNARRRTDWIEQVHIENATLKRRVADLEVKIAALQMQAGV